MSAIVIVGTAAVGAAAIAAVRCLVNGSSPHAKLGTGDSNVAQQPGDAPANHRVEEVASSGLGNGEPRQLQDVKPVRKVDWFNAHDVWCLYSLGALNVLQALWWTGVLRGDVAGATVCALDVVYMALDLLFIAAVPDCVPGRVRTTLLIHHVAIMLCSPVLASSWLNQHHLMRSWIVELHSWNHIAARKLGFKVFNDLNKPLFVVTRLIGFPAAWFLSAYARSQLSASQLELQAPARVFVPLSVMHLLLYGLMLSWGRRLLFSTPEPAS